MIIFYKIERLDSKASDWSCQLFNKENDLIQMILFFKNLEKLGH